MKGVEASYLKSMEKVKPEADLMVSLGSESITILSELVYERLI
jgi:hypothetical protein